MAGRVWHGTFMIKVTGRSGTYNCISIIPSEHVLSGWYGQSSVMCLSHVSTQQSCPESCHVVHLLCTLCIREGRGSFRGTKTPTFSIIAQLNHVGNRYIPADLHNCSLTETSLLNWEHYNSVAHQLTANSLKFLS